MIKKILICIFIVFLNSITVYGNEIDEKAIDEQLALYDFSKADTIINENDYLHDELKMDFGQVIKKAIMGELDISPIGILNMILKKFFSELYSNTSLIRNLIIVCILSAFLKNLTEAFKTKETGELGFYISYIVIVAILFSSFSIGAEILKSTSNDLINIMSCFLPIIISLLAGSGNITSAYIFQSMILFFINVLISVINYFLIPLLTMSAVVEIINYLTQRDILTKFSALLKSCINWAIRGGAILFISVLSLQRIAVPVINNAVNKSTKAAVNMVPVVGDVLTGAIDSVLYWADAVKGGTSIAIVIVTVASCLIPLIKLMALIFIYKFTAAVIQPISDKRITECIDTIGDYSIIMLSVLITILFMFIFSVIIMLNISNV